MRFGDGDSLGLNRVFDGGVGWLGGSGGRDDGVKDFDGFEDGEVFVDGCGGGDGLAASAGS